MGLLFFAYCFLLENINWNILKFPEAYFSGLFASRVAGVSGVRTSKKCRCWCCSSVSVSVSLVEFWFLSSVCRNIYTDCWTTFQLALRHSKVSNKCCITRRVWGTLAIALGIANSGRPGEARDGGKLVDGAFEALHSLSSLSSG